MKARAPGKVVLSGAYSVLEGAPALVSAVDRYVVADGDRTPDWISAEVAVALGAAAAPHVDASELRAGGRKLGLGSSAAILVASLAARSAGELDAEALLELEERALRAHRQAQGGGSGIDVAASVRGGSLICRRSADGKLALCPIRLPASLVVEVWASGVEASTRALLASVGRLAQAAPHDYRRIMRMLHAGAEHAELACQAGQSATFIGALSEQCAALAELGAAAGEPIITAAVGALAAAARAEAAVVLPSGAGGGDIALWVAERPSSVHFRRQAARHEHVLLPLELHARGVHSCG